MRILFILKKNEIYGSCFQYTKRSSGLWNSTRFIAESLRKRDVCAELVEVQDNNCIDREVTRFKPDIVVIEALWVVPEKFPILQKLHPKVKWFVHMHSGIPFLALEGIAMEWLAGYAQVGVGIIANDQNTYNAFKCILPEESVTYLPNVYLSIPRVPDRQEPGCDHVLVGSFGAIRPMKNQLIQAIAAIQYAKDIDRTLYFYVNGTRSETGGDPVLKNLRALFGATPNAWLVESKWCEPEEFLELLKFIDIGLQVSLTETFNVVCADYVTAGIPVVGSDAIEWLCPWSKAQDDDVNSIVKAMHMAMRQRWLVKWNRSRLNSYTQKAQELWFEFVTSV